jgi:5'-nucleotidase
MRVRPLIAAPLLAGLVAVPLACGGSDAATPSPSASTGMPAPTGTVIMVTNDDGVSAPGLDAVVNRLRMLPGVSVQVVAPASNESGTGGRTTSGTLRHSPATTASGYPATAVDGFPADTVRVALDDLKLRPALVVSGVNKGQNVGPIAGISGTVGAARAAAQRGIPAIAVSSGQPGAGGNFDFAAGADYAVREAQKELPSGGAARDTATIANINVPSCTTGSIRGLQDLPADTTPDLRALGSSNCTSTRPPSTETESFLDGFAVLTRIPARA